MVVAPIVLDGGACRHRAATVFPRQSDFAFQIPVQLPDQLLAPLRWWEELERRKTLRPPAVLPRQAHARLDCPVCETRLVDPGGSCGGRSEERRVGKECRS